jgi:dTDP-4-dehydrorhamnose reductase
MNRRILITGAQGALGADLADAFFAVGWEVAGVDRAQLDITDTAAVRAAVAQGRYDAIVNAAAWNDVDGAEDPAKRAAVFAVNAEAPGILAEAARAAGAMFVHYSTDYVFSGTKPEGYVETDVPDPISVYGESKAAGERAALAAGGRSFVVRTSKLYGRPGVSAGAKPSFAVTMLKLAATKPELSIVDEEVGMPTTTRDLAEATVRLLTDGFAPGIYHLVNEGPGVTWYAFAEELFAAASVTTPRKPVPMSAFPRPAKRPLHAALRNTKFPPLRTRSEAIRDFLHQYAEIR